ncbi:MAG: hypothetical protein B6U87_00265 [Candidatus Aenigmarchaeota archaeon ex4484_52]|nr:MAG: hypothetical protein B6U87_00265 [Candidatus Aenigmarchaeota archaeon ex4484_52]
MQIINLDEYSKINNAEIDYKIKYLANLKSKQFRVAEGFVITNVISIFNFGKMQANEFNKCLNELENTGKHDIESINNISKKMKLIFENLHIQNEKYKNNIYNHCENIFLDKSMNNIGEKIKDLIITGRNKTTILRPFAFYKNHCEENNYCFPVFDSKKKIWKNQVINAIKQIILSFFNVHSIYYCKVNSISIRYLNFSILVQEYLDIDSFGSICFKNPDTKNNEIIIESYFDKENVKIKHIDLYNYNNYFSNKASQIEEENQEKTIISLATKCCSVLDNKDLIMDWFCSKGKIYISNIREIRFASDDVLNKKITATAKLAQDFNQDDILIAQNFQNNALFFFSKSPAVIFGNVGQLSDAARIAREMKIRFIDKFLIHKNNITLNELINKKIQIEYQKIQIEDLENNFFPKSQNFDETLGQNLLCKKFFSKTMIKIDSQSGEEDIEYLKQKSKFNDYYFLFDNDINANSQLYQLFNENKIISQYYELNNLKEIILFDFNNNDLPKNIFINTGVILLDIKNKNINISSLNKISKLIIDFIIKNKQKKKKIILGVAPNDYGKDILKQTIFYADFLLVSLNDLDEFEKMHNLICNYEQEFIFNYVKNKICSSA